MARATKAEAVQEAIRLASPRAPPPPVLSDDQLRAISPSVVEMMNVMELGADTPKFWRPPVVDDAEISAEAPTVAET